MPKVSVIIPTYNNAKLVTRAIDSVLTQTFTDQEIIVVNDGSTDNTESVLSSYTDRITVVHQPNLERAAARNNGIQRSSGRYIAFLDDDDWWHPKKLEKQVNYLDENPAIGLVCSFAYQVGPDGAILGTIGELRQLPQIPLYSLPWFFLGSSVLTLTVVIKREIIERAGGFEEHTRYIEDWDLWMRSSIFSPVICVPEPLAYYQLHGRNVPSTLDRYQVQDSRLAVLERVEKLVEELGEAERLPEHIRLRGKAKALWQGALIDYAVGKLESAKLRASQSFSLEPTFFHGYEPDNAAEIMVGFAISLEDIGTSYEEARYFIENVLCNLPNQIHAQFSPSRIKGELAMWYGHYSYRKRRFRQARSYMVKALITSPTLITNRGLLSVLCRSTVRL